MDRRRTRGWALVAFAAATWLTTLLAGGTGSPFDDTLGRLLYVGHSESLTRAAAIVTSLGGWPLLLALAAAFAVRLVFISPARAAFFVGTVFAGRGVVELMKTLVDRARPLEGQLVSTHSMSFPSGHAANALITYVTLALLEPRARPYRSVAVAVALALAAASGASRVALGVHWASDVIGGWALGVLWVWSCFMLAARCADEDHRPHEASGPRDGEARA